MVEEHWEVHEAVLVSAGTEFVVFPVAGMELGSGFQKRVMLTTHRSFSCRRALLTQSQGRSSCPHCPASQEAAGAPGAGRGHSQDSWPKLARAMSHTLWGRAEDWD